MTLRMWVLTPGFNPVGGVVKIFDYVRHALDADLAVTVACPTGFDANSPLWQLDAFAELPGDHRVEWIDDFRIAPQPHDFVFFSWPDHIRHIQPRLPEGFPLANLIHIVQNTRHVNPEFNNGWGIRTLARPMTRIAIVQQVMDAIEPLVNPAGITTVLPYGHRAEYFHLNRPDRLPSPLTVGYTTWKSDIGDRVAEALAHDNRFEFRAIREPANWEELRELYHSSDVFLCCPNRQEGFYLPGLEAMAAGCVVLTPDAEGNLAYAWFDENCLEVGFEDVDSTVAALHRVLVMPPTVLSGLRTSARERVDAHAISAERDAFIELLGSIDEDPGPRLRDRPKPPNSNTELNTRFTLLTGIPRSGTTLVTRLLNTLPDVVALGEPMRPGQMMHSSSRSALVRRVVGFFEEQRRSAIEGGRVRSKTIAGRDVDNYVSEAPEGELRVDIAETGEVELLDTVSEDVHLVIKDLSMSTAILSDLADVLPVAAIVRNPVAILASWHTVDMPMREGRAPHAEWFSDDLDRRLNNCDAHERRLRLLEWWFEMIAANVPSERILRYEDVVASGGKALEVVVPAAAELNEDLSDMNRNSAYRYVDMNRLVNDVLERDEAPWSPFYNHQEIEALRPPAPSETQPAAPANGVSVK